MPEHRACSDRDGTKPLLYLNLNYKTLGILRDMVAIQTSKESHKYIATFKVKNLIEKLSQFIDEEKVNVAELGKYTASKLNI